MKCIIVDDEPIGRRGMKRLVERDMRLELAGMFPSAESAEEFMKSEKVDLVFLDIQMPGITGLEFAAGLTGNTMVIFTTAYSEYAVTSYELDAVDYLVKPIEAERFDKAVAKAVARKGLLARLHGDDARDGEDSGLSQPAGIETKSSDGFMVVKADRRFHRVAFSDILYAEGLKDYVVLHMRDRKLVTRLTMKNLVDTLPAGAFMRTGKSYVVNLAAVDSFDTNDLYIGDTPIPLSPTYRDNVLARFLK